MIEITKKITGPVGILNIGYFDIYNPFDDQIYLKELFHKLFKIGETLYFFFRREEDLTDDDELTVLRKKIFSHLGQHGQMKYIRYLDQVRFDAIAYLTLDIGFGNLLVDMFKYFYSVDFFVPINGLTFDEYEDYLDVKGVDDIDGINIILNSLTNLICIKGYDGDHLRISYNRAIVSFETLGL